MAAILPQPTLPPPEWLRPLDAVGAQVYPRPLTGTLPGSAGTSAAGRKREVLVMRLLVLALTTCLFTGACATWPAAGPEDRTLPFGCNDVVVVARVANGAHSPVETSDDVIGRGWVSATLRVRRLVRGAPVPPVLSVRYSAHGRMREDRDFMLVLKRTDSGFEIATGQLMSQRPRPARRCD